eukprot:1558444-Rhodomonas_salina.4
MQNEGRSATLKQRTMKADAEHGDRETGAQRMDPYAHSFATPDLSNVSVSIRGQTYEELLG